MKMEHRAKKNVANQNWASVACHDAAYAAQPINASIKLTKLYCYIFYGTENFNIISTVFIVFFVPFQSSKYKMVGVYCRYG